ncbi:hypothetical protein [Haploplasma axanthum]|uniref:Uncharacterized protein n=1 Tax=Haploplasma axanthum TaxID=29552 RepID=A0A449BET8_HAPAX|nr:hypothetical protein [Haploplasma axanthum]VEU80973.1 Uncharacterised protein [Haploplasma axanthum]
MTRSQTRLEVFNFLGSFHEDIRTKFTNISGKTGSYSVPLEIFQRRTHRKNRSLITWSSVRDNNLTIEQLDSFSGGVTVELVNEDYFNEENRDNPTFIELINRIGSDENVSAILTFRSETGTSSSFHQREYFNKLLQNTEVYYKGNVVVINENNYSDFYLKQDISGGIGNEKWSGFLFVSIRGGQQNSKESHSGNITLFNPAVEYLNADVALDLDLTMAYFAMHSIKYETLEENNKNKFNKIMLNLRKHLREAKYESEVYTGNLLDYCDNHPSVIIGKRIGDNILYDPIQVEAIDIMDFSIKNKNHPNNLDFTHDESVNRNRFVWDSIKKCVLPPSRPTNVFWSKHLSNMMQQDFTLEEFFKHEEVIVERRRRLL